MFFSHTNGYLILILDVQSSIVRGTLVHVRDRIDKPLVLFTRTSPLPYKQHARSGHLVRTALDAIKQVIQDTLIHIHIRHSHNTKMPRSISSIHYVLSSPWIISHAKTLSISFKSHTTIDRRYIEHLISEDRRKLVDNTIDDVRVIEEKIFDVRLNGYSISSWEGRSTDSLEISFVASVAGGRMMDKFIDACGHAVKQSHIHFHSSLFLQHIGISSIIHNQPNYALIHIHGELTDVALIHNNSCIFFGSFPFGVSGIIRTIARESRTDLYTAESTLNLFMENKLDPSHGSSDNILIERMRDDWIAEFKKLVNSCPTACIIPHHAIISARSHEDFFIDAFRLTYPDTSIDAFTMDKIENMLAFDIHTERLRLTGLYTIAIHSMEKDRRI